MEQQICKEFINNLKCPVTGNRLSLASKDQFPASGNPHDTKYPENITFGLREQSGNYFYPVIGPIMVLHEQYAIFTGRGHDIRKSLSLDRQRVFDYYNEISYLTKESLTIYDDSARWVDYRDVSLPYLKKSFARASRFYPASGKYLLDIASGPIGHPEFMELSTGYEYRICVDISVNALIQAGLNLEKAGQKGILICGDITNIPIIDNTCDTVLSQHTLYHIPAREQKTAVEEMYRVAKPGSKIVIIYSWFYHSWFMNLSLNVVQLYRIARHFAGKAWVRLMKSKPRLYFYSHSPGWFKRNFSYDRDIEFHCWRSTNKYFLNIYIHKWLGGESILRKLSSLENKYSRFMGIFGEYPAIVITKSKDRKPGK
ncbi:MAG: class I SAM-dependent methyltransferase [Bacteroidota bacterium]